jgi:hypothetical protein
MIRAYQKFILNIKPNTTWKVVRFLLHWITLPLKLIAIGGLGITQIILKSFKKQRPVPEMPSRTAAYLDFRQVFLNLPVLKTEDVELYVNRVPFNQIPTRSNYNTDHQCSRHATYAFLMNKLGKYNSRIDAAVAEHIQPGYLCRGWKLNPYEDQMMYNVSTVSGDMLCGLNLAMLGKPGDWLKEKYDQLITDIIQHDYSLLEGGTPDKGDYEREVWDEQMAIVKYPEGVRMKSSRGMWHPGLETVGAQALTLLSSLRVADKKLGSPLAKSEYKKMLWLYGYGLLSIFPTAYTDKQRGYFNDHNCLIALYTLSKLADNSLGRLFWKIPMVYVWLLSRHWYNGYFTGLVKDCYPEVISQKYVDKCIAYLYENQPRIHGYIGGGITKPISEVPVTYNDLGEDEFSPDIRQDEKRILADESSKIKTGLGWFACAVMLDPKGVKEFLD